MAPGSYNFSFWAAQRIGNASRQTFEVLFDDTLIGIYNFFEFTAYTQQITNGHLQATASRHTLTFRGTNQLGGDNTVFIDAAFVQEAFVSI